MRTVFLVGAGFSASANPPVLGPGRYPLAADLAKVCFPAGYDLSRGVESAFADSQERGDRGPIERLVEAIQAADSYVGYPVATDATSHVRRILGHFPSADFLTFNYDCLLELSLLESGRWNPGEGFGVPVEFQSLAPVPTAKSSSVLHLHGSLYLYPREVEFHSIDRNVTQIKERAKPAYAFDPDALGSAFGPYQATPQDLAYRFPAERIVAPVPDKGPPLAQRYVREVYAAAQSRLRAADRLIVVGYSFSDTDRVSYAQLLEALAPQVSVIVVSPDAAEVVARVEPGFPNLDWSAVGHTFEGWAGAGFLLPTREPSV